MILDNNHKNKTYYDIAKGSNGLYNVWHKYNYKNRDQSSFFFSPSRNPYDINIKNKNTIHGLHNINRDDVSFEYNKFASILRKYNIGGRENAFDKLVNLFLAKIVDEEQNPKNLQFRWKGFAQDTYSNLMDRLQILYKTGMKKYLGENVAYVSKNDIIQSFRLEHTASEDAILNYFKELKYYSNSNFAFIDVYNKQLFINNSHILVEVVKMLENMRIYGTHQNQFLGDLFEGFLDSGVHQTEGQFFTPLPIVQFMIYSLPIKELNYKQIPKVIDFATGSAHFLTNYASHLSHIVPKNKLQKYYCNIWGIEKEYRLSKVAKVSTFMYGQKGIHIIYGDALRHHTGVYNNSYSLIISNPPYSVKGFLDTIPESDRKKYLLYKYVNNVNTFDGIQLFFVERAIQLLKPGGIAGIILPSSILSNDNPIYVATRKMMLRHFYIIAIVTLGSHTFGSTGTNTSIFFLRKREYPPKEYKVYKYSIDRWFSRDQVQRNDIERLKGYCNKINIPYKVYLELQTGKLRNIWNYDLFKDYQSKYKGSHKKIDVNSELQYIIDNEKEKILYYELSNSQNNKLIVVQSPTNKVKSAERFLGYKWSKSKSHKGILYTNTTVDPTSQKYSQNKLVNNINTPLFNPKDINDTNKINKLIYNNFEGKKISIPSKLNSHITSIRITHLTNLMSFRHVSFNSDINIDADDIMKLFSHKYSISKLGQVVNIKIGATPSTKNQSYYTNGTNLWLKIDQMRSNVITNTDKKITTKAVNRSSVKRIPNNTTLLSFKLTLGRVALSGKPLYTNEAIAALIPKKKHQLYNFYLFILFYSGIINLRASQKSFGKSMNKTLLKNTVYIPVPPLSIQRDIIARFYNICVKYKSMKHRKHYTKDMLINKLQLFLKKVNY